MVTPLWSSEPYSVGQRFIEEFPAPTSAVLNAQAEETFRSNPTMAVADALRLSSAYGDEESALVSPDDARKRINDEGLRLDVPQTGIRQRALDMLITSKAAERDRQLIMQRAEGGVAENAGRVGVTIGTALLDPLNIAAAFIPVVGEARWAKALAGAGSALGRAGVRVGYGAVEGAVGAALIEPLTYGGLKYQQADYSLQDSVLNVAFGTAFGAGLHMGAGAVTDAFTKGHEWWRAAPQGEIPKYLNQLSTTDRETILRSALGQAAEGKRIDIESLTPDFRTSMGIDQPRFSPEELQARSGINTVLRAADEAKRPIGMEVEDLGIRGEEMNARTKRLDDLGRQAYPELYKKIDDTLARIDESTNKITDEFPVSDRREANVQLAKDRALEITKQLRGTDITPLERQKLEAERGRMKDITDAAKELGDLERRRSKIAQQIQRQNPPLPPEQKYNFRQVQEAANRSERPEAQALFDQNILDEFAGHEAQAEASAKKATAGAEENPTADVDAESSEIQRDLKTLADKLGIDLTEDLKAHQEPTQLAEIYGKALASLAECGLRRG